MFKTVSILTLFTATVLAHAPANSEAQIWNLEKSYWEYVKSNDLEKYRALWHEKFVGWPSISSSPLRKDHITDWITANTSKGLKLESYEIEQLEIQVTADIAVNHYRIKFKWANSEKSATNAGAVRITHTWIRAGSRWEIIGGMSAQVNEQGK